MHTGHIVALTFFCTLCVLIALYTATSRRDYFRFRSSDIRSIGGDTKRRRRRPLCSFPELRRYLRRTGSQYLPGDGVWSTSPSGRLDRFEPSLCRLKYSRWVPRDRLARCLTRLNISYVVILGDSNALRLYKVARRSLSAPSPAASSYFRCDVIRRHDVITPLLPARRCSPTYLPLQRRYLPPNYFRCTVAGISAPLLVQYLPVTGEIVRLGSILNSSATGCVDTETNKFVPTNATTLQEYLLSEYMSVNRHQPDVILYMSSSWEQNSLHVYADLVDAFISTLHQHRRRLSTHTKLIVVSRPDEFVPLKPSVWRQRRYESGTMTRNQWINASNHILHTKMSRLFVSGQFADGPEVLLFPDIAGTMRPVLEQLAVDGVHSTEFWYSTLWSYIMQTLCANYV